jgi:hypothetical protein
VSLDSALADVAHAASRLLSARQALEEAANLKRMPSSLLAFMAGQAKAREVALRVAQVNAREAGATERDVALATLSARREE